MNQNQLDLQAVNELKMLSLDMINHAGGGYPGIVMDMSPVMFTLYSRILNVYPDNPKFMNRDRVIVSASHMAPLYYATLYMAGYPITKDDLMMYRRLDSKVPGLPEKNEYLGIEATTGYAGDGVGISVGIEMARRYYDALIKKEDNRLDLLNFTTYCLMSDADMMSGSAYEAMSLASAQNLSNLVFIYDANNMNGEGPLNGVLVADYLKQFQGMGFYVDVVGEKDAANIKEIERAINAAKNSNRPALVVFKNIIGKDSFNEGKNVVHGTPLSFDDMSSLRRKYNLFLPPFEISKDSVLHLGKKIKERTEKISKKWNEQYAKAKSLNSESLNKVLGVLNGDANTIMFDASQYKINDGYREEMLESSSKVLNLVAKKSNLFLGGSAEGLYQCKTIIDGGELNSLTLPLARNIRFGAREAAMAHILNGMSLMGLRVYGSTRLCFANEMKAGIRSSAVMNLPVTYIFTHDSLYSSMEGPTRIPVDELAMLRSIPNLYNFRPADIVEMMSSWQCILSLNKPCSLLVSTASVPKLPGSNGSGVMRGGYIIKKEYSRLDGIIIATGSEVVSAMQISYDLYQAGIDLRVVSMPSVELFLTQGSEYIESVLPSGVKTAVIEALKGDTWYRFATNPSYVLSIDDFAYSGAPIEVLQKMNFDYDSLKAKIESLMK